MSFLSDDDDESPISSPPASGFSSIPRSSYYTIKDINCFSDSDDFEDEKELEYRFDDDSPKEIAAMIDKFKGKLKSDSFQEFDENFEIQNVADTQTLIPEGVSVHMNNVAVLIPDKINNRQYFLSWKDISKINSTEASRYQTSFFTSQYYDLAKWNDKNAAKNTVEVFYSAPFRFLGHTPSSMNTSIRVFHYLGMGFPPPRDGKICITENGFGANNWKSIKEIKNALQTNILFIFDCDKAESLRAAIEEAQKSGSSLYRRQNISALFACGKDDSLHIPETLPQNIFTCILLDPIRSIRNLARYEIVIDDGMLKVLISVFTESIARDFLDQKTYSTYFLDSSLVSSLWKNYILAQKLLKGYGITVHSHPELPDCSEHYLWSQFQYAIRCTNKQQIDVITNLHVSHFLNVPQPNDSVCSFIAALMKNNDMYENIIITIANFMKLSPKNCAKMSSFIDPRYIGAHRITQERSIEGARAWNIVISGILLVQPGSTKSIAMCLDASSIVPIVHSLSTDDVCRRYLLTTIIALIDGQTYFTGFLGNETRIKDFCNIIFVDEASPETRLMYSALMYSIVSRSQLKPSEIGPKGMHMIAKMLLEDDNALTRAIAVGIIGSMLYKNAVSYNNDLLRIALPAAIDGSYRVRGVFVALIRRFAELGGELGKEPMISIKRILRRDIENPSSIIGEITGILTNDPCDEVHKEALTAQATVASSDCVADEHLRYVCSIIQRTAHGYLFSSGKSFEKGVQMYPDEAINSGGLELFEVLPAHENSGSISSLSFDRDHVSVAYGSVSGTLVWGENQWRACTSAVTDIAFIGGGCLAAASSAGSIYIMKSGFAKPVDLFTPSLLRPSPATKIAIADNSTDAFISSCNTDIVHWDLASLRVIDAIELPSAGMTCSRIDNELVVALWDGRVVTYDTRTLEAVSELKLPETNKSAPLRIGRHLDERYIAFENGPCVFFEGGKVTHTTEPWSRATDMAIHPTYGAGIIIGGEAKLVDINCRKVATLSTAARVKRCCFDGNRPLAAIGNDDGTVAIWRIPKDL